MAENLQGEIQDGLEAHKHWQSRDFVAAQALLWLAIFASVFGGLITGSVISVPFKWLGPLIVTIPGAALLIDRTFKFAARSSWHALYGARLRSLNRRLRDQGVPVAEVAKDLDALEIEMEKLFPSLDPGLLREKAS